ncbi:MAG: universal stress protein [Desulfobacula sp.]|jgi:nucleotide-binding universal stress UspA family protein
MSTNTDKILVALDGSERAFRTIDYLCSFKPFLKKKLVLHNIITKVPMCYYDLKKDPFSANVTSEVRAWELSYKAKIEDFMEKARMKLIVSGFKPENISVVIAERKNGIARDILDEAKKGYEALLIRRRGGSQTLLPFVLGSVSTKLVEKADQIPVILAGIQKVNHSLLLAIDGSEGSKRSVEFTAELIKNSDCRIVLCSVLRDFNLYDVNTRKTKPAGFVKAVFEELENASKDAESVLEKAGIQKKKITVKLIEGADSRSEAIIAAAMEEKCDTLVFGRKGKSNVDNFDIGSIPWKAIQGAREMTIWIVP